MATRTEDQVQTEIKTSLESLPPYPAIMPECADFLLSQINPADTSNEVTQIFNEYFIRQPHKIFNGLNPKEERDIVLGALKCAPQDPGVILKENQKAQQYRGSELDKLIEFGCCLPCSCITLEGNRRLKRMRNAPHPYPSPPPGIKRLLQADVIWLFYFERMGIFKIMGALLDDFANNGKYPIPTDNVAALILEMMTRHVKMGISSTVRDRAVLYARVLGWKQDGGQVNLDPDKVLVNSAFTKLFHRFVVLALAYYKDKRLADAIQGTVVTPPSIATVIAIQDTISLLKNAMESFTYGRNYYNTLNGIVWAIATINLLRKVQNVIGIPANYDRLDQVIPAAYNILMEKKSVNLSDPNRYKLHLECATDARDVLIDIAGNSFRSDDTNDLKLWLNLVEDRIEGYRAAYLELTGIDLAKPEFRSEGALRVQQEIK